MSNEINLPDFIVIGAMKAGTTTLYEQLRRHPEIGMSREKETDFFVAEKNWKMGLDWYGAQFPASARLLGEASPNYTKAPAFGGVAGRIAGLIPHCKLIFVARDPVLRAQSHYRHAALSGQDVPVPEDLPGSPVWQHLIEASSYAAQLAPYLALFPAEQLLVLDFTELCEQPARSLSRVAAYLDVEDRWPGVAGAANSGESLAQLPEWLFRFRETRLAAGLKRALSPGVRGALKAGLQRERGRIAPGLDAGLTGQLAEGLAGDAARFRRLTGMDFADWQV